MDAEAFFLSQKEYPDLYALNPKRPPSPGKAIYEPIEQLSPKGLALLSHLYAIKDKDERQPVIAATILGLKHITKLVDEAEIGTNVTIIFQPTDLPPSARFSPAHKTVFQLERHQKGLVVIHMDGSDNPDYADFSEKIILQTLKENAIEARHAQTPLLFFRQKPIVEVNKNKIYVARQMDGYQCGIFAIKDARQLNRDRNFVENQLAIKKRPVLREDDSDDESEIYVYEYDIPAPYLKMTQSRRFASDIAKAYGHVVVNRKGETLEQFQNRYKTKEKIEDYVQHFSNKYRSAVLAYYETYQDNPKKIQSDMSRFDASQMTAERLAAVYGVSQPEASVEKRGKKRKEPHPRR